MKMRLLWMLTLAVAVVLLSACGPTTAPFSETAATQPLATDQPSSGAGATLTSTPDRPLAAVVNGQPIPLADYERQVAQYQAAVLVPSGVDLASPEGQQRLLQAREQILNYMIEQVLIEQAAAEQGIVVTDEQVDAELAQIIQDAGGEEAFWGRLEREGQTREDVWNELRAQMISGAFIDWVIASVPTSAEHVHARHILVDTREEAERLLAQLQAGADFPELARAFSQDPSTRENGGDLSFFPRGVLLAREVEEAAFSLHPGQISLVIESVFGFHIVQVVEREPDLALTPENLKQLREQAIEQWIEALWAQAMIERYVIEGS